MSSRKEPEPQSLPLGQTAQFVLNCAREDAFRLGHVTTETHHLLLGMLNTRHPQLAPSLPSKVVLEEFGLTLEYARRSVEFVSGRRTQALNQVSNNIPLSPRVQKVIKIAESKTRQAGRGDVTDLDLLEAIITEGENLACSVLENFRVDMSKMLAVVAKSRNISTSTTAEQIQGIHITDQLKAFLDDPSVSSFYKHELIRRIKQFLEISRRKLQGNKIIRKR